MTARLPTLRKVLVFDYLGDADRLAETLPAAASFSGIFAAFGEKPLSFARLPFAGGWTQHRDLPAPQGRTFQDQWARRSEETGR